MAIPPAPLNVPAASVPPRTALLTNITEQTSLLHQLFTVLANPAPNAQSTNPPGVAIPSLYADLQARTKELESITEGLWEHQRAWAEMKKKEGEVRALESQVKELISELEGGRRELEGLIQDGQEEEEESDADDKKHERRMCLGFLEKISMLIFRTQDEQNISPRPPLSRSITRSTFLSANFIPSIPRRQVSIPTLAHRNGHAERYPLYGGRKYGHDR